MFENSLIAIEDATIAPVWGLANVLLAIFAWQLSGRLDRRMETSLRLCTALVVATSVVLLASIFLGTIHSLNAPVLLAVVVFVSGCGLWFMRVPGKDTKLGQKSSLGIAPTDEVSDRVSHRRPTNRQRGWSIVWGLLAAWGVGHVLCDGLARLPTDFDCLMYHLPIMDEWLQQGTLYIPHSSYWWTPGGSELIGAWMVAPFSGDFNAPLNNVPFVAMWAAGTFGLARAMRLPTGWSHLATLTSLAVYTTLHETDDASNDLAVVAYFMAGALFGWRLVRGGRTADLALFSLCVGALCGIKYFALGYAALLTVFVAGALWRSRRIASRNSPRIHGIGPGLKMGMALASLFGTGGYWYLRNWVFGGSPIYPMGMGYDIATGYPRVWETTLIGNGDVQVPVLWLKAVWNAAGPLQWLSLVLAPILILTLALIVVRSRIDRRSDDGDRALWLGGLLIGSLLVWIITPWCVEDRPGTLNHLRHAYTPVRYGLSALTVASLTLVFVWVAVLRRLAFRTGRVRSLKFRTLASCLGVPPKQAIGAAVFTCLLIWQCIKHGHDRWLEFRFVDSGLVGINLFLFVGLALLVATHGSWLGRTVMVLSAVLAFAIGVGRWSQCWHEEWGDHFDRRFAVRLFNDEPSFEGKTFEGATVCVLDLQIYPFFGSRRQHHVIRPRQTPTYTQLAKYLREQHANLIVTCRESSEMSLLYADVDQWLRDHRTEFTPIWDAGHFAVFRRNERSSHARNAAMLELGGN